MAGIAQAAPTVAAEFGTATTNTATPVHLEQFLGQTFRATQSGLLTRIDFQISRDEAFTGRITSLVAENLSGTASGRVALDGTAVPVQELGTTWTYTSFDYSRSFVELQAGNQYATILAGSNAAGDPGFSWATGAGYTGGVLHYDSRTYSNAYYKPLGDGSLDGGFRVWVDPSLRVANEMLTVSPVLGAEAVQNAAGGWDVTTGGTSLGTQGSEESVRRALLEFDLSAIPEGAVIDRAELTLDLDSFSPGPEGELVTWALWGYAGNGVAEGADAMLSGPNWGVTRWRGLPSDPTTIRVNPSFLEDLLDGSDQLGLTLPGPSDSNFLSFWGIDGEGAAPSLSISYRYITAVPEPGSAFALVAIGAATLMRRRSR